MNDLLSPRSIYIYLWLYRRISSLYDIYKNLLLFYTIIIFTEVTPLLVYRNLSLTPFYVFVVFGESILETGVTCRHVENLRTEQINY